MVLGSALKLKFLPQSKFVSPPTESQIVARFPILFDGIFIFVSYKSKTENSLYRDRNEDH